MNAPLYDTALLRLAATIPHLGRLTAPQGSAEKRSAICGSRVVADVDLAAGAVAALGLEVSACALGQAAAHLMSAHAIGRRPEELAATRDAVAAWLAGEGPRPDWPGLEQLDRALPHTGRHAAIRLPFEAAAEAAARAKA
jgi:NifU-like protein involved in Fe-S cluster formation